MFDTSLPIGAEGWKRRRDAFLAVFARNVDQKPPFFEILGELLDQQEDLTLGELLAAAGEQTYGLLVLVLALPSLIPGLNVGAAPVGGLGIMALGVQMLVGIPQPWVPARVRNQALHRGRIKEALARVERQLSRFRKPGGKRHQLHPAWTGLLLAWTGFILAIPVPLFFGNLAPAAVLVLLGAALLEERPVWGWLGALGSAGITAYFGLSFTLIIRELQHLWRLLLRLLQAA